MKKAKHTEEQIIGVLKQVEAGRTVKEVARELGVSEATIYTWKSKYGGMEVSEARRLNAERPHSSLAYRTPEGLNKEFAKMTLCRIALEVGATPRGSAASCYIDAREKAVPIAFRDLHADADQGRSFQADVAAA